MQGQNYMEVMKYFKNMPVDFLSHFLKKFN